MKGEFVMQELVQKNKKQVLKHKNKFYFKNTPKQNLYMTLPQLSTFNEKDLKPYWNLQCQEMQSILWLPHKTVSQEVDLNSLDGLLNFQEEESNHWKRVLKPKNLIPKSLLVSLPASATPTMEKGQLKEKKILKVCKKIRFYPQNELKYQEMLILYRRAYNLAIEKYINNEYKDGLWRDLRKEIRFQCEEEQKNKNSVYNSNIVNEAVLSAKVLKVFKNSIVH